MADNTTMIYFCFPCSRHGKYQIATYFCANCDQTGAYICWQCKQHHKKFQELGTHHIQLLSLTRCHTDSVECSCVDPDSTEVKRPITE